MGSVSQTAKIMFRNFVVVIGMAMLGALLLVAAFLLPIEPIENNVSRSIPIIEEEGSYPSAEAGAESVMDNFTDSLLLLEASNHSDWPVLMRSMMVWHSQCDGGDPFASLIAQGKGASDESTVDISYGRYWHGSLVYLKPLLTLFDLSAIRIVGGISQGLLVLLIVMRLIKLNRPLLALGFTIGYFSVSWVALAKCLQYWPSVFVMLATCLAVLVIWERKKASAGRLSLVFSVSGALLNYLDLLTFPLVALAVPLILYFALEDKFEPVRAACRFALFSVSWLLSYGLMWILKWVLGSILTGTNFFTEAIGAAEVRSGISNSTISFVKCVFTNLDKYLNNNEIYLVFSLVLFALVLFCISFYAETNENATVRGSEILSCLIPIALASILVPLWYRGLLQHSFVHPFMTNRDCWVFGFALALGAARVIELLVECRKTDGEHSPALLP